MITVDNVSKNFGQRRVLNNISFEVKKGEVLGLLGPNGAGKTTMMRILTGFFPPTRGKVTIEGLELSKRPKELKRRIGYLPERLSLYPDIQVEDFLNFVAEVKGVTKKKRKQEVEQKIVYCGLLSVRDRLIGRLSKGFLQRVGIAQALIGDPSVLIMDEPTNGLDPGQIIEIRELIRDLGRERTLILSTHILPEVSQVCDRVLILNQGRIVAQGSPEELEEGLQDRQEILVRVGTRRASEEEAPALDEILASIPGVESVERLDGEDHVASYFLRAVPTEDLRSEISKRIVAAGFPLLELTTKRLSLEDIFLRLVVRERVAV